MRPATRSNHHVVLFALLTLTFPLWIATGCGGGRSSSAGSPASRLDAARMALGNVTTGQAPANSQTLAAALKLFQQAHQADPSNQQASFGFAIVDLAVAAQKVIDLIQTRAAGREDVSTDSVVQTTQAAVLWNAALPGAAGSINAVQVATTLPLDAATRAGGPNAAAILPALNGLATSLNDAIPLIENTTTSSDFTFSFPLFRGGQIATVVVDQSDAQAFLAALYFARAAVHILLAYNLDPGNFNLSAPINSAFASNGSLPNTIAPDLYLPPAPFGTPKSNAASLLRAAKADLSTAADRATTALASIQARIGTTQHLIDGSTLNYTQVSAGIAQLKAALTQPTTVSISTSASANTPLTINLSAWFSNPPNLRALLPTYRTVTNSGVADHLITTVADYPDPTEAGLLVGPPAAVFDRTVPAYDSVGSLATHGLGLSVR